jgi:hypothetical protein
MISILTLILILIATYLGFLAGVVLGIIAPEEMFFFKKWRLNSFFVNMLAPIIVFLAVLTKNTNILILATSVCFLSLFPYGSKEVSVFVKNDEIKDFKGLWKKIMKKSIPFVVVSVLIIISYFIFFN